MTLLFLGYNDKAIEEPNRSVHVKVFLVKKALKKRKDISDVVQTQIGAVNVTINPKIEGLSNVPALSIDTTKFEVESQSTYSVVFRIELESSSGGSNNESPPKKRFKGQTSSIELTVIDRNGPCLLNEGEYDMIVQDNLNTCSPKKMPLSWEVFTVGLEQDFSKALLVETFLEEPSLKFRLLWTNNAFSGRVNYPMPEYSLENKENSAQQANVESLNNNNNTSGKVETPPDEQLADEKVRIIYQFVYNNNSRQQTEATSNFLCPWCSLNCRKPKSLMKHLKLCHARFVFNYAKIDESSVRIDVAINENYDGSYTGSPHDLLGPGGFARTPGPKQRSTITQLLVCGRRRNRQSLQEFLEYEDELEQNNRPYISGHNRVYHHTATSLPIMPNEFEIDSEDECVPVWLQQKTVQMIDDFTDVNDGEKELMKLWNLHVMKFG